MTEEIKKIPKKRHVAKAAKPYARLTPRQWAEAEALWESGEASLEQLAKRFGKTQVALSQHFTKKGIVKGSAVSEHARRVKEEVAKASLEDATVLASRIKETKEEHYKMASNLAKLTWAEILQAKQSEAPISTRLANLKALDTAMNVLKKAREERYSVLGLDRIDAIDESEVPELVISELTADQIESLRDRNFNEDIDSIVEIEDPDEIQSQSKNSLDDIVEES